MGGDKEKNGPNPLPEYDQIKIFLFLKTWSAILPNITSNLVDSMVRSCQAVTAARGGSTKY